MIVSIGAILAALSRPPVPSRKIMGDVSQDSRKYTIGVMMLVASLLLTAALGLLQERTYKKYGPCWREGVFYTVCCIILWTVM
jgi:UDP-xylose/UDP-N-acetylglucosamine transporter B4